LPQKRLDIQILRAIAVSSVILYHLEPNLFLNGYLGVDVFFVISGFVIAKTLYRSFYEIESQRSKTSILLNFYRKRFHRLVPALTTTLIFTCILMWALIPANAHTNFYKLGISSLVGIANIGAFYFGGNDYFNALPNPIIHTWSLSVETQLYLISPFLFYIANKYSSKLLAFIFFVYLSFGLFQLIYINIYPSTNLSNIIFYSLTYRSFEFTCGVVAFKFYRDKFKVNAKLTLILIFVLSLFLIAPTKIYLSNIVVISLTTIVIVLNNTMVKNNLTTSKIVEIGDRSYSIYLIHMPIIYILEFSPLIDIPARGLRNTVALLTTYILGSVLFLFIENKYSKVKGSYWTRKELKFFLVFFWVPLFLFIVCLSMSTNNYISHNVLVSRVNFYQTQPKSDISDACNKSGDTPCQLHGSDKINEKIILVGDSQAASLSKQLSTLNYNSNQSLFDGTLIGCPFYLDKHFSTELPLSLVNKKCQKRNKSLFKWIISNMPNLVIIKQAEPEQSLSQKNYDLVQTYYANTLNWLRSLNTNVLVVGPNPRYKDLQYSLTGSRLIWQTKQYPNKITYNYDFDNQSLEYNNYLSNISKELNYEYIDLYRVFCDRNTCLRGNDLGYFYIDNSHLSSLGAKQVIPLISELINN
jgi:peptidoglycan/LPS O-acetylase OafA/YrhL